MAHFKERIAEINSNYSVLEKQLNTGNCGRLSLAMSEIEAELREYIQEITKKEMLQIISKLESGGTLDQQEIERVKLWVVGDAHYYAGLENNFNDWMEELKRLIDAINQVDVSQPDFTVSSKLRAMLLDAVRTVGDIMFFLEQKERVEKFAESTQEIDPQERELLIQLLKSKIISPEG